MLRIITHIERLLLVHDCVIVPKFGGFVLQTVSAVCNGEEHLFSPHSAKRNRFLISHYNITTGYFQSHTCKCMVLITRKAQLMLEEDVDDMKAALQEEKRLSFALVVLSVWDRKAR